MDQRETHLLGLGSWLSVGSTAAKWADLVRAEIGVRLDSHPNLAGLWRSGYVLLYGSTSCGVDDAYSDIDLLLLVREEDACVLKDTSGTDFFDFPVRGKAGHLTVEPLNLWQQRLRTCQMPYIYQLRNAIPICGETPEVGDLLQSARKPLPGHVAHAFAAYHYTEMRSWHRSCDNAMERHDPVALLLLLPQALADAMRAALIMQGVPYPYDKWLYQELVCRVECASLCASLGRILELLGQDGLQLKLRESANPISNELRAIRQDIIEMAKSRGWDEPWLDKWWLHMDEIRDTVGHITWE